MKPFIDPTYQTTQTQPTFKIFKETPSGTIVPRFWEHTPTFTTTNKNVEDSILYCKINELKSEKIMPCSHKEFLTRLNKNKTLVFFPKTLETLSRIVVEARMLNCKVVTNKKIGATSEEWFRLKGQPLIDKMREKRLQIPEIVLKYLA